MSNYKQGKIYLIMCDETNDIYIGSTCDSLKTRLLCHRRHYRGWLKGKRPNKVFSFDIVKYESAKIKLLCDYPCGSKEELLKKEGEYIKNYPCINNKNAGVSYEANYRFKQYECPCGGQYKYHSKAVHMKSKKHKYYEEHGKVMDILPKSKTIVKCPCGGSHNLKKHSILTHKKSILHKYYEEHGKPREITTFNESQKCECGGTYLDKIRHNKSKIHKAYLKTGETKKQTKGNSINCPCGGRYTQSNVALHNKTKKHKAYLQTKLVFS